MRPGRNSFVNWFRNITAEATDICNILGCWNSFLFRVTYKESWIALQQLFFFLYVYVCITTIQIKTFAFRILADGKD